jgi:cation diffusion facilitator family transporter
VAESKIAIYGAIAANVAIAVTKFIVASVTGSSAMLAEGIHSLVDTGNGALLLVGLKRSQRPASEEHPFGHGKELYFWSLIVAVLIFGLGGGISFYEGVIHVSNPLPLRDPTWNFVVLGSAMIFEGASFLVAWRQFSALRGNTPLFEALRVSKDPTTYTVLAEDFAALAGLVVAAVGIGLGHWLHQPWLDGAASMVIGLLLAGVATLLIREARGLLIGEGVKPETARQIREIAAQERGVVHAGPVLSMYVGAQDVLVTFDVVFEGATSANEVAAVIRRIERRVRERFPKVQRIYIEAVTKDSPAPDLTISEA